MWETSLVRARAPLGAAVLGLLLPVLGEEKGRDGAGRQLWSDKWRGGWEVSLFGCNTFPDLPKDESQR